MLLVDCISCTHALVEYRCPIRIHRKLDPLSYGEVAVFICRKRTSHYLSGNVGKFDFEWRSSGLLCLEDAITLLSLTHGLPQAGCIAAGIAIVFDIQ
jgi:hypothetical protein